MHHNRQAANHTAFYKHKRRNANPYSTLPHSKLDAFANCFSIVFGIAFKCPTMKSLARCLKRHLQIASARTHAVKVTTFTLMIYSISLLVKRFNKKTLMTKFKHKFLFAKTKWL